MKLAPISKSLAISSLLALTVACGQPGAQSPQKVQPKVTHLREVLTHAPTRNAGNAVLTCDQIWSAFVAENPLGLSKGYRSTSVTEYSGGEGLPAPETVVETSKDTVIASSDASVVINYEYTSSSSRGPIPAESQTLTKSDFLATCNVPEPAGTTANGQPTTADTTPAPTVEVLDQGTEKLTVEAGAYDTDWIKGKVTQAGDNAYTADVQEWYLTGTNFLVKSIFASVSMFDSVSVKTTQTVELISYVNPATT